MAAQSAAHAGATPCDPAPLGWLILIPLGCLVLGQALLAWTGITPVFEGQLADPDSYMRLNRVLNLHDGGAWFDPAEPRVHPPDGHVQHWTRPVDALLLAGAWLLQPVLGFADALHVWGVLFSPVCLALAVVALSWASAPLLDRDARLFACLAMLAQPTILAYSSLGRADHHALLLLLFVVQLGLTLRILLDPLDRSLAVAAGLIAALALWISPESLAFIAPCLAVLGWYWLLGGNLARQNRAFMLGLVSALALGLVIERGPTALTVIENDRLSLVHLSAFALFALFWTVAAWWEGDSNPWFWQMRSERIEGRPARRFGVAVPPERAWLLLGAQRTLMAVLGMAVIACALLFLFPELRLGPLGPMDPLYAQLRLARIVEIQPLLSAESLAAGDYGEVLNRVVQIVGIALFAVPFLATRLIHDAGIRHRLWFALAAVLAVFLPLAFHQVRWSSYAQIALILPYSAFVGWLLTRIGERTSAGAGSLIRPLVIVLGLFWPLLIGVALPRQEIQTADEACPVKRLAPVLDQAGAGSARTILALADYGPELLYRTSHRVLSIPNHRPQTGFAATYRVLTATDQARARAAAEAHGVDWILLCPSAVERDLFEPAKGQPANLYRRLLTGAAPAWLRPLPAEDLTDQVRLFEVVALPALAEDQAPGSGDRDLR